MRAMYEFMCPQGHVMDHFCDSEIREMECACGRIGTRIISRGADFFKIDGFRSDLTSERWAKARINNAKRHYDNTGE